MGIEAWAAIENYVKGRGKEDNGMVDTDLVRPKVKDITKAWESVAEQAALIRVARGGEGATKQHRKAISKALQAPINPDVMSFCVSGLLWQHAHPTEWAKVLALAEDRTPYHSIDDLEIFTRTYLHLLAVLPLPLLPTVTAKSLFVLSSRDSHNSFGIRSLEDEGSEFFGYGCWPAASYFNHSCNPNVEKKRVGRTWEFRAGRHIESGEELCITYLSGEERKLSRGKRNIRLLKNWGFECGCERCEPIL
jgi:SET and MYND domain-containing protein